MGSLHRYRAQIHNPLHILFHPTRYLLPPPPPSMHAQWGGLVVGAETEPKLKEKNLRVEDDINATNAVIKVGALFRDMPLKLMPPSRELGE